MMYQLALFLQDAASVLTDVANHAAPLAGDVAGAVDPASAAAVADPSLVDQASQAAVAAAQVAQTATVDNPYSLESLWLQGDFVARFTLLTLVVMSAGTWYILAVKYWEQRRILKQAKTAAKKFWSAKSTQEGMNSLEKNSAFRSVVEDGLRAAEQHEGALSHQMSFSDWMALSLNRTSDFIASRLQGGLSFLATVGSTAPFVGLFGTVWGIYHALIAIGLAGQASIDKVAGPVGEALIMTAIGLAVAVPAVLGYNWLVRRNKIAMESVRGFSSELYTFLLSGAKATETAASAKAAAATRSH